MSTILVQSSQAACQLRIHPSHPASGRATAAITSQHHELIYLLPQQLSLSPEVLHFSYHIIATSHKATESIAVSKYSFLLRILPQSLPKVSPWQISTW
jgi:hypothetical protein